MIEKIYKNLLSPKDDILNNINITLGQSDITDLSKIIFADIETTGLSSEKNRIYLIGCMYFVDSVPVIHQFFSESPEDEKDVLIAFNKLISPFSVIVEFNGDSFDIPFIKKRCDILSLPFEALTKQTLDLYKMTRPYSKLLSLENLKQKTIEIRLGINREDIYSGGDLIKIYNKYVLDKDSSSLDLLLLHNKEDVLYMLKIFPIIAIDLYFKGKSGNHSFYIAKDNIDNNADKLVIETTLPTNLCCGFTYLKDGYFIYGKDNTIRLSVDIVKGTLKYFFKNYKDYYYLPQEDTAIHKDVAMFVDKAYRKNATASTCYVKKEASFIPVYSSGIFMKKSCDSMKFFKKDYSDKTDYMEISDINNDNIRDCLLAILPVFK